jgi:uncharacterized protein
MGWKGKKMKPVYRSNLFVLLLVILQVVGSVMLGIIFRDNIEAMQIKLLVPVQLIFFIVPSIIYLAVTKLPIKETLRLNKISSGDIGIIIVIVILSQPVGMFFSLITSFFFENTIAGVMDEMATIPYIMQLGIIAVTPAICEEISMRGIVLSGYKKVSNLKAAVMTGILFGIIHLNAQQLLYTIALGILFAYIVIITDSIWASIIAHFIFNGIQVTLSNVIRLTGFGEGQEQGAIPLSEKLISAGVFGFLAVVFTILIVLLVMQLQKRNSIKKQCETQKHMDEKPLYVESGLISAENLEAGYLTREDNNEKEEKVINGPFIATVVIYIILISFIELASRIMA